MKLTLRWGQTVEITSIEPGSPASVAIAITTAGDTRLKLTDAEALTVAHMIENYVKGKDT